MHEWGITEELIGEVYKQAKVNKIKKVAKICVSLGKKSHLTNDSLKFCFQCLTKGTILENTELETSEADSDEVIITSIEGIK